MNTFSQLAENTEHPALQTQPASRPALLDSLRPDTSNSTGHSTYRKLLVHDGERVDRVEFEHGYAFLVISGCVKRVSVSTNGGVYIDEFYVEGDFAGLDLPDPTLQVHSLIACGTACVAIISLASIRAQSDLIIDAFASELSRARRRSFYVAAKPARVRVAWFICSLIKRRYQPRVSAECWDTTVPMSRVDIASYLGLAAETVSRELTSLAKTSVIAVSNRNIRVLDPDRLESLAELDTAAR